jgi:hypothetical protein
MITSVPPPSSAVTLPKNLTKGDHFNIAVCSNEQVHLDMLLAMAFAEGRAATHYVVKTLTDHRVGINPIDATPSLVLCRPHDATMTTCLELIPLPYPVDASDAGTFAGAWLKRAPRGKSPNIDGTNAPNAFTIYAGSMSCFNDLPWQMGPIAIITPGWSVYSK